MEKLFLEKDEESIMTADGVEYVKDNYVKAVVPQVQTIYTNTLSSVIDYVESYDEKMYIHVKSENCINIISELDELKNRDVHLIATAETAKINYDSYMDLDEFNLMIQSCFADNKDKSRILAYTGSVEDVASRTLDDDGVTQKAVVRTGITTKSEAIIPNPVSLRPYRTFSEIEQPESKFIFRMQSGPVALLKEVKDPVWRTETIKEIKKYLETHLKDITIFA